MAPSTCAQMYCEGPWLLTECCSGVGDITAAKHPVALRLNALMPIVWQSPVTMLS
ncbi:hypothetical protein FIBSPDRAFT_371999 [Athelia psychrophila]|uniref:Uncharacterized protein n=1 Tax=Athelia psychrophila TaxID=1759441 RepID=A0A166VUM1_9AGAM|nr:hypothetical protein FIBSPDRAFT_371999 [Fibularhizoctonia sp. CBS 109695]